MAKVYSTYVKKKLDALGKLAANNDGTDVGLLTSCGRAAMMPDERVVIKKPF